MNKMNTRDLRRENLVTIDGDKPPYRVMWIKEQCCQVMKLGIMYASAIIESDRIKPIPLTEEWAVKLGLQKYKEFNQWYKIGYLGWTISFNIDTIVFWLSDVELPHIKYVHQAQNLYFDLTGEELEIKN